MTWTEIFGLFTKPLFQIGQTWVSLATLAEFILVLTFVVLFSRVMRRFLRTRVLAHTKLDVGLQYAIARIAGYMFLALGLLISVETLGVNLSSLTVLAGTEGWTRRIFGASAITVRGTKSLSGSYGTLG